MRFDASESRAMSSLEFPRTFVISRPVADPRRRAGRLARASSAVFAAMLISGLYLEYLAAGNWNAGQIVLAAHLAGGGLMLVLIPGWMAAHLRSGLGASQRRRFTLLSWLLLAKYAVMLATGLALALPLVLFLGGTVWFWRFGTTDLLGFVHLWASIAVAAGLIAHLTLRHWRLPAARSRA